LHFHLIGGRQLTHLAYIYLLFFLLTLQAEEDVAIRVLCPFICTRSSFCVKDAEKLLEKYPDLSLKDRLYSGVAEKGYETAVLREWNKGRKINFEAIGML